LFLFDGSISVNTDTPKENPVNTIGTETTSKKFFVRNEEMTDDNKTMSIVYCVFLDKSIIISSQFLTVLVSMIV
jgi:hypothetical protein